MYIPPAFLEDRLEVLHDLIRAHPLGLVVSSGPGGLQASPVPFQVYPDEGGRGTLRAHLARANGQWPDLAAAAECLVVFQGEQGYVTPSWYPSGQVSHEVVPTWNYVTVQAWGRPRIIDDPAWLARQVAELTEAQERRRVQSWSPADAPPAYIAAQLQALVGLELAIDRIEGKWKLSQNRTPMDRAGVIAGLARPFDPHENQALAKLVAKRQREDGGR